MTPSVALIGCGQWGQNHARVLAEMGALIAVCDDDAARADEIADRHGVKALPVDDVLASEAIESVVIAAPAAVHASVALAALRAGKDCLVEKPLALDLADAEAVQQEAVQRDRVLMVGHLLQYHPAFERLAELVASRRLGRLRYLYSNRLNLGRIRREEDILWSFAPHDVSMILTLVGDEPTEVSAIGANYLHESIADVTTTHLRFPAGVQAHVFVSWLHPFKEQKLVVVGEDTMAVFDDGQPMERKLVVYPHEVRVRDDGTPVAVKADAQPVEIASAEPLRAELEHFLSCVESRATPRTDGLEAIRVLRVLRQAADAMTK